MQKLCQQVCVGESESAVSTYSLHLPLCFSPTSTVLWAGYFFSLVPLRFYASAPVIAPIQITCSFSSLVTKAYPLQVLNKDLSLPVAFPVWMHVISFLEYLGSTTQSHACVVRVCVCARTRASPFHFLFSFLRCKHSKLLQQKGAYFNNSYHPLRAPYLKVAKYVGTNIAKQVMNQT